MRYCIVLVICVVALMSFKCVSQGARQSLVNPFDSLSYTQVKLYRNLLKDVTTTPYRDQLKGGKSLNRAQIQALIKIVGDTATYGNGNMGMSTALESYDFIFFNSSKSVVGQISINLHNNYLLAYPDIPARTFFKQAFGNDTLPLSAFSNPGRLEIERLLDNLGVKVK